MPGNPHVGAPTNTMVQSTRLRGLCFDAAGGYNRFDPNARASGPDPGRRSYASFLTFNDPGRQRLAAAGNYYEVPGVVIDSNVTAFSSESDLARRDAARSGCPWRAREAQRRGRPELVDWYAAYMVAEQSGNPPPS